MKYDPVEQIAHIRSNLQSSSITEQMDHQGALYVRDFIVRTDEGEVRIAELLAEGVQDANAFHRLGDQYRVRQRYQDALKQYEKAIALEPSHPNSEFNLAACLEYIGDYQGALLHYGLVEKLTPKDPDVPYRLARTYLKIGNLVEAEKYIERALSIERTENSLLLKAELMTQLGRTEVMIATYFEVLKLNPKNTEVEVTLSDYLKKW